ncbi:MAG: MaoC family dehydratase N-terminal domain-containing protein [Dermatophilaceae bacterium]|jgi:acyl dehydratase|nr:MaoC family dehydratase N-terminal domain-containing protein [Actinomycetales bacterium]MBP9917526.1 MaoC family dehydratase N-terminal domain-containing protein [Dermatophilaceae bacterium]
MPVNAEAAGRSYPPMAPYLVSAAKIAEFAAAVGATDPVHVDSAVARERGYRDVIAPPTFAVLIAQQCDTQFVADPAMGIDFSRVVHGQQTFEHHRPLTAGDAVTAVLHVDSVKAVAGNAMVTTRSELHVGDQLTTTSTSMLVVRGENS